MNLIVTLNVDFIVNLIMNLIVGLIVNLSVDIQIYIKGVSTNTVFFRNQNARYAGTRCTLVSSKLKNHKMRLGEFFRQNIKRSLNNSTTQLDQLTLS